jgi:hypothetical protein
MKEFQKALGALAVVKQLFWRLWERNAGASTRRALKNG